MILESIILFDYAILVSNCIFKLDTDRKV